MRYQNVAPLSKQITILTGLFVVGMMAFGLALSYYKNVLFEQRLETMKEQNNKLRDEITVGYDQLEYLRSAQYKDKYAKQNLNRINAGEKVLILRKEDDAAALAVPTAENEEERRAAELDQLLRTIPIVEHWRMFLFYPDRLEELRKSL